jgi:hypothetical protein
MEKQDTGPYRKNYQKTPNIPINKDINKIRNRNLIYNNFASSLQLLNK